MSDGWWQQPFAALDFETTGTDVATARVVQAALIRIEPDGAYSEKSLFGYVNPGVEIPADASKIHGITAEKIAKGTTPKGMIDKVLEAMTIGFAHGLPLVIFNAPYDWPLLLVEAERVDPSYKQAFLRLNPSFIDPLCIDRHFDRYRKGGRKLETLAAAYKLQLNRAHSAKYDAWAAAHIARAQTTKFPLQAWSLGEMQAMQASWHTSWVEGMNSYFKKIGRKDTITGGWPV